MPNKGKQHIKKNRKMKCYICKQPLLTPHHHYAMLCRECGVFNEQKRIATHDLHSFIALVTGGRTKIGYYTSLRLLRNGAQVIITTRFPYDAYERYMKEPDFTNWKDRIHIYGLDFRRIDQVENFATFLEQKFPYIDIIINNAAQTVRMPVDEYNTLAANEVRFKNQLMGSYTLQLSAENILDFGHADQLSTKPQLIQPIHQGIEKISHHQLHPNAWIARADQISAVEMLEVQLINVTAPFLLNSQLKSSMLRSPNPNRFIINVSSVEGKFQMKRKGRYHVHTNMAKASLNMMTLTLAKEYKKDHIFITSVDPGWVSNQYPKKTQTKATIQLPLDFQDAAARICDPIYTGKDAERPLTGVFLKDYQLVDW